MDTLNKVEYNRFIKLLIFFLVSFFCLSLQSSPIDNKGRWVQKIWPRNLSVNLITAAGGNCLICADYDSSIVLAYETNSHQWHEYQTGNLFSHNLKLSAGDNVALLWHQSDLIAFNAFNQTFYPVQYSGSLLDPVYGYGCKGNNSWFITDQKVYIFDAEASSWDSLVYQKPGGDPMPLLWVYSEKKYILFELRTLSDPLLRSVLVYSSITKSFSELNPANPSYDFMKEGFVFWNYALPSSQEYFGGYSVNTAEFTTISPGTNIYKFDYGTDQELLLDRKVFSFWYRTEISHPVYTMHYFTYNVETGSFYSVEFPYNYAGDGLSALYANNGSNITSFSFYNKGGDNKISYVFFNASNNTYNNFESNLLYGPSYSGQVTATDVIIDFDLNNFMAYDVEENSANYASLPPPPPNYHHQIALRRSSSWAAAFCKLYQVDTMVVYNYNRFTNQISSFKTKSTSSVGTIAKQNILAFKPYSITDPQRLHIYTPADDTWHHLQFTGNITVYALRDFLEIVDHSLGVTTLYDGTTGQYYQLTSGAFASNYFCDNFLIVKDNSNNNIAYSTYTKSVSSFNDPNVGTWMGMTAIALKLSANSFCAYNALFNCFTQFDLLPEHGVVKGSRTGDSTALVYTSTGYLFAYDPYLDVTHVVDENYYTVEKFELSQNYPNPFNPSTRIQYAIGSRQFITLKVYDVLGNEIATLVNEEKPAGRYEVEFNPASGNRHPASGIYFCRLQTENYSQTIKMLYLK